MLNLTHASGIVILRVMGLYLVLTAYESICFLSSFESTAHYPNADAVAHKLSFGNPAIYQQMYSYFLACAAPAYGYFRAKFYNDLLKH